MDFLQPMISHLQDKSMEQLCPMVRLETATAWQTVLRANSVSTSLALASELQTTPAGLGWATNPLSGCKGFR